MDQLSTWEAPMQIGDLVMIKQGFRMGKVAVVVGVDPHPKGIVRVIRGCGDWFGYYKHDLEVLNG
jgi:hypothetical protein